MENNNEVMSDNLEYITQLEEDLADLERYVEDVISSIPNPFYLTNPNGIIIDENIALEKLTKCKKEDLIGKSALKLFSKEYEYKNLEKSVKINEKIESRELNLITADGSKIPALIDIFIRKNYEGNISGFIVTIRDLRDLKRAEIKSKLKINELKRFNKLAVDRELRMIELKDEVNHLLHLLGHQMKYDTKFTRLQSGDTA
jgi:PAS domain S-box-containing protein